MYSVIVQTPKRHFFAWLRLIWTTVCENPSTDHFIRRVREKINQNKKNIRPYIWRICPDAPLGSISANFGLRVRLVDIINSAKFYRNRLRGFDSVRGRIWPFPLIAISPLIQGGWSSACVNKTVLVIIMCSKVMFLQRFKDTDHYYIANIWCSRRSARFVSCGF